MVRSKSWLYQKNPNLHVGHVITIRVFQEPHSGVAQAYLDTFSWWMADKTRSKFPKTGLIGILLQICTLCVKRWQIFFLINLNDEWNCFPWWLCEGEQGVQLLRSSLPGRPLADGPGHPFKRSLRALQWQWHDRIFCFGWSWGAFDTVK